MVDAIRDKNHVPVLVALSYVDGTTLVPIKIDASSGGIEIDAVNTFSGTIQIAPRPDDNRVKILMAVNNDDGTLMPCYADPVTGGILVGSN